MKESNKLEIFLENVFTVVGALVILGVGALYVVYKMKNDR